MHTNVLWQLGSIKVTDHNTHLWWLSDHFRSVYKDNTNTFWGEATPGQIGPVSTWPWLKLVSRSSWPFVHPSMNPFMCYLLQSIGLGAKTWVNFIGLCWCWIKLGVTDNLFLEIWILMRVNLWNLMRVNLWKWQGNHAIALCARNVCRHSTQHNVILHCFIEHALIDGMYLPDNYIAQVMLF